MSIGNYQFNPDLAVEIGEKALVAVAILIATWLLAKAAQWAFTQLVSKIAFLRQATGTDASIGESLGRIVSLLIWLLGLLAILQVLSLGGVMGPVETLLNNVMGFIPRLVGAGLIFFIGMFVARIARDITVTALQTVDFDKWANKGGVDSVTGNNAISKTLGTIVYILIIIPVAIAALEALNLTTVSEPASDMLRMILGAVPNVLGGAILLGIGYVISRFAAQMLREVLPGLGVDRSIASADILPEGTTASALIARIAQIAIVLFFAIAATRILGFAELTAILDKVLELGGRVIFGSVVIVAGFFIAGLIARLVSGAGQNPLAASIVRWTASVLFTFMGLQFMGVGEEIVEIAFAALVIGTAVAGALAFGLGGREWAARKLDQIDRKD